MRGKRQDPHVAVSLCDPHVADLHVALQLAFSLGGVALKRR
jgi:hypothetical protein